MWIEIRPQIHFAIRTIVTPLAGVWIEIFKKMAKLFEAIVTPLAGVWIEIPTTPLPQCVRLCHSPCGSVD